MIKTYNDIVNVKLISYTQPSSDFLESIRQIEFDTLTDDLTTLVSYCARVSNPSNQTNLETSEKLIQYLIKHKHWSPFEMVNVCLEITSTRDIVRQILRHRSFSFQEFSQRYANPAKELDFCVKWCRLQDKTNRQNSLDNMDNDLETWWVKEQLKLISHAKSIYDEAINKGVAKEVARVVLPEGNTISRLYINGSIRSWIHFIEVRTSPETQKEHRMIAQKCAEVISNIFEPINDFTVKENN